MKPEGSWRMGAREICNKYTMKTYIVAALAIVAAAIRFSQGD